VKTKGHDTEGPNQLHYAWRKKKERRIHPFFSTKERTNSIELNSGIIPTACYKAITTIACNSDQKSAGGSSKSNET
jgi:hypothetical protein